MKNLLMKNMVYVVYAFIQPWESSQWEFWLSLFAVVFCTVLRDFVVEKERATSEDLHILGFIKAGGIAQNNRLYNKRWFRVIETENYEREANAETTS